MLYLICVFLFFVEVYIPEGKETCLSLKERYLFSLYLTPLQKYIRK